jgi:hypothetical protein
MVEQETTAPARLREAHPANEYVVPEETRPTEGLQRCSYVINCSIRQGWQHELPGRF